MGGGEADIGHGGSLLGEHEACQRSRLLQAARASRSSGGSKPIDMTLELTLGAWAP
jgi:hypothetical protein